MYDSLYAPEVEAVLSQAGQKAGQPGGPFPSPADWRDQPIYFLMVDRFNNASAPPAHLPYDDPGYYGFQGGKFSGIQKQLGYIKGLGAGALWLSPVLRNLAFDAGSYHGYGIHDFLKADPRFADAPARADDELRALVDAAHAAGLYVIFDIVLNHTGDVFAYADNPTGAFSPAPLPVQWRDEKGAAQAASPDAALIPNPSPDVVVWPLELRQNLYFRRQGNPDPNGDDTVGDFASLKQLRTDLPSLQAFLIRAYQYVIARYDIDGFRVDTLRYLKGGLPLTFGNAVREFALGIGKKNFFTYGEVLDGNAEADIAAFIGRNTAAPADDGGPDSMVGVDAALDYPLFNTLKSVAKGLAPPTTVVGMYGLRKRVEADVLSSHGDATRFFVTFLDNHDMKERLRYAQPGNPGRFDGQVTLGLACLYTLPGIPCLYYGTEQGLHGAGTDPAVREALWGLYPGFPSDGLFYREIQKIAAVRAAQPALRYGRFYFRPLSGDGVNFGLSPYAGGVLAFSRILNDREVAVAANTNSAQGQTLDMVIDGVLNRAGQAPGLLYSNQTAPTAPAQTRLVPNAVVAQADGSTSTGPALAVRVVLAPMEVQVFRP